MRVTIKLFATLREGRFKVENWELPARASVKDVLERLGIKSEGIAIILVNGRDTQVEYELQEGDAISLFPPVGGG
ncbi:MAG: MoaD/ThiS family protein [Desulfitobacteriaceae bacterium]|nr:MoaD/ThiS family protein [Desulfitobacteriaceae bacterium]MDI6877845.1 MoaD/ThiS family protein [Desulfitobacteriaceae bacterium]MDI6912754.1 MoaD/ThiS family protein [Desulfitobacteriaceae bacterium]